MRVLFSSLVFLFVFFGSFVTVNAQYGNYGCFGRSSTGGCQTSLTYTCTNGGVVPNPSECNGVVGAACNSASFACQAPPASGTCTTAADCPTFYNCINSVCVASGGNPDPGTNVKSGPPIEGCGIKTAIGCIPIQSEQQLASFFLRWGMGLGGGIALILIVVSTFMTMTSAGDPKKLQAGKELLTSAVSGLILLVFAAYILNIIGVDILGIIPGGGTGGGGPVGR